MLSTPSRAKKVAGASAQVDISIVLNIYREALYLARTMDSVEEAVAYAKSFGHTFELIVTLDNTDDRTRAFTKDWTCKGFERVEIVEVNNNSLGLSRNDGIALATGKYISTCDSDDLISFNIYRSCWEAAQIHGENACIYPEYLFLFGGPEPFVHRYYGSDFVPATLFLDQHPYTSRIFALRTLLLSCPYQKVSHFDQYAYEDWLLNSDLLARGCRHEVAPNTVVYYRQRQGSLARKFERTVRLIPPSELFEPETYVRVAANDAHPHSPKRKPPPGPETVLKAYLDNPLCEEFTFNANRIDPGVSPQDLRWGSTNRHTISPLGDAYFAICRQLANLRFDDVILLPYMTTGGGEKYMLNVMNALSELRPHGRFLFLFGQKEDRHFWLDRLPPNSEVVDLANLLPEGQSHLVDVLTLRVIQTFAPGARLHVKTAPYTDSFFAAYGKLLSNHRTTYYRFSDAMYFAGGRQWYYSGSFNAMSENFDCFGTLLTDHDRIIERDRRRFGVTPEKWKRLYTYCQTPATIPPRERTRRLLWASRLAHEKRPEIFVALCKKLLSVGFDGMIDVYGREGQYTAAIFESLANVNYKGSYESLSELNLLQYDALIYTSAFDGLPNIVLEMLGAGVPVIAPGVGGVGEAVQDHLTGFLLPETLDGDALVDAYVEAILTLYRPDFDHEAMRSRAHAFVQERHAWPAFVENVRNTFDLPAVKRPTKRTVEAHP